MKYGEEIPFSEHGNIRSREACLKSSSMAVELAKRENAKLHVLHITTEEELKLFEAGNSRITAEACVHHLWFEDQSYSTLGSLIKCNPAIKKASDRDAIRKAVKDGRISILATDHAPHTWEEKQGTYFNAPSGLPLIQHTLLLMLEMCEQNCFSPELIVERACHAPARLFQVEERGYLREGYWADIVVVDPEGKTEVKDSQLFSKCGWSPFSHLTFTNSIETTIVSGQIAYHQGSLKWIAVANGLSFPKNADNFSMPARFLFLIPYLFGVLSFGANGKSKPNVILFLIDDLGWSDIGINGSTFYETPFLDKMAKEGAQFTDAYAASPVCSPPGQAFSPVNIRAESMSVISAEPLARKSRL